MQNPVSECRLSIVCSRSDRVLEFCFVRDHSFGALSRFVVVSTLVVDSKLVHIVDVESRCVGLC